MMAVIVRVFLLLLAAVTAERSFSSDPPGGSSEAALLEFPLSGQWTVVNANGSVKVAATVPGTIYTDLMRAGVLGDPYYRFNDVLYRWVAYDDWTYTRTFNVSGTTLSHRAVWLDCHGLDTVAEIRINSKLVRSTTVMFHRYTFDVKDVLKEGINTITVSFTSPVRYAKTQAAAYPYSVPPKCPPAAQNGDCSFNFIRKEASSFSWDWGPALPTMGIWKPLFLRAFDTVTVHEFTTTTVKDDWGKWHLRGSLFFEVAGPTVRTPVIAAFSIPGLVSETVIASVTKAQPRLNFDIVVNGAVSLWWPHTHGTPTLYNLTVTINVSQTPRPISLVRRVGFRTVKLVQERIPGAPGLSFYFRVNGQPVFMKGSNWIPADSFQERVTVDYLRHMMTSARDTNMNMLRVWGGGIYESETFYELADELGILLWQDLMFACAFYPTDPGFLTEVETEVRQQVRRLMSHPSVAIWAGNNENEAALAKDWYNTSANYTLYYKDYVKLYVDVLRPIVLDEDPSRPFVTSSPSNGEESELEGWVARNPYDTHFGDVHFYNYSADSWDWRSYPVSRFASEYGVQSWCSYDSLMSVSLSDDLTMGSTFLQHRQHRTDGNKVLETSVARHLPLPKTKSTAEYFKHFIYLTQIDQAVAMQTESELYRRSQSSVNRDGNGHTMGALFWQLNDIWQAPTWASIEYGGKWKMLHYYAKKFFSRTLISPYLNGSHVNVFYIQDNVSDSHPDFRKPKPDNDKEHTSHNDVLRWRPIEEELRVRGEGPRGLEYVLVMTCFSWHSLNPLKTWRVPFTKPQVAAGQIYTGKLSVLLREAGCTSPEQCFLHFSLQADHDSRLPSDQSVPDSVLLLTYPNKAKGIQKAIVKVTSVTQKGSQFEVSLATDNIALYVWLDSHQSSGRFSDNGFVMVEPTQTLTFYPWDKDITAESLRNNITILSLSDVSL